MRPGLEMNIRHMIFHEWRLMRAERSVWVLSALAALLIAGCERAAEPDAGGVDADNPLEIAARQRGVVQPEAVSPVGVFERAHDLAALIA